MSNFIQGGSQCVRGKGVTQFLDDKIIQDPIYKGHYPELLKEMLGERLPDFSEDEWKVIKGSSDFYGLNTYSTFLVRALLLILL